MTPARRPWKVRWWSQEWAEWMGTSYATEERAMARAKAEAEERGDAKVWCNDGQGYVVPGTMRMIRWQS